MRLRFADLDIRAIKEWPELGFKLYRYIYSNGLTWDMVLRFPSGNSYVFPTTGFRPSGVGGLDDYYDNYKIPEHIKKFMISVARMKWMGIDET